MNANELADELDKFSELGGDVFFGMCADLVRQQQTDKTIALEIIKCHEQTISQQQAELEALKAHPVKDESWIDKEKLKQALKWDAKQRQPMQILEDGQIVPVLKEPTDEEIWEVWKEAKNITLHTKGAIIEVVFAKAILRKAQEK